METSATCSSWQGIRESTAFGKACSQPATIPGVEPPSEDCLSLNVVTGAKKVSDNLPVMVWLHGGGYTTGAGITHQTTRRRSHSMGWYS